MSDATGNNGDREVVLDIDHGPITSLEEDKLDRGPFIKMLARGLENISKRDSMVIALYGDWGSGKSSVLNLCLTQIEADLDEQRQEKPLVVRFNPWWYSDTGELLVRFFDQLASEFSKDDKLKALQNKLISYRNLVVPMAAVGDLAVSGGLLTGLATVARAGLQRAARQQQEPTDPVALKKEIEKELKKADRRVLVVIDDVDRLSAQEIRDVFKLVKAVADFPNTHYLLALDFNTTKIALDTVQGIDGGSYIEKIVQVPFRIPEPSQGRVASYVIWQAINAASSTNKADGEVERTGEKLTELSGQGLERIFSNMRRANRFLDSVRLTVSGAAGEVRLIDLLLLEALRILEPACYEGVIGAQDDLLGSMPPQGSTPDGLAGRRDDRQEANRETAEAVERIAGLAQRPENSLSVKLILAEVFPRAEAALEESRSGAEGPESMWIDEKRACLPEFFRIATSWALPEGGVSDHEIRELVALEDPESLRSKLKEYDRDPRPGIDRATVFERLAHTYRTASASAQARKAILYVLFSEEGTYGLHADAHSLSESLISRIRDSGEVKELFLYGLRTAGLQPVAAEIFERLSDEQKSLEGNPQRQGFEKLTQEDFEEVSNAVREEFRRRARDGTLTEHAFYEEFFYIWHRLDGDTEPKAALERAIDSGEGLLHIARHARQEDDDVDPRLREDVVLFKAFALKERARDKARSMLEEDAELSEHDRIALTEMATAIDRS